MVAKGAISRALAVIGASCYPFAGYVAVAAELLGYDDGVGGSSKFGYRGLVAESEGRNSRALEGNWCFKRDMTMAVPLLGEDLVSWMRLHLDGGGGGWHVESHYSDDDWEESNGLWSWRQITENIYR